MNVTKPAVASVGFWGGIVAAIIAVANLGGVNLSEELAGLPEQIAGTVDTSLVLVAALIAAWGRIRAKAEITGWFKALK